MKYSKDDIIEALERCSLIVSGLCEGCPLASVMAEHALELINKLLQENKVLTEQRDTFREYAYHTQAMVENIDIKMNGGYDFSTAKHAAEMDMWRVVAAEKKILQDENERLRRKLSEER